MPAEKKPTTVTYGDLVDGDIIIDKSGNEWPVSINGRGIGNSGEAEQLDFWLGDPKQHRLQKPLADPVTALRVEVESHAAEVERLEAEFPGPVTEMERTGESVEVIAEALDAEVVAEESAEESDQRRQAEATGEPVTLPAWAELTHLEQQSHLYLLHGVYAADVTFGEKLTELHDEAHASDADRVPHVHTAGTVVA
jgi:hypothetical protein